MLDVSYSYFPYFPKLNTYVLSYNQGTLVLIFLHFRIVQGCLKLLFFQNFPYISPRTVNKAFVILTKALFTVRGDM